MSELLRIVRADRRGHRSRLIARGTLVQLVERARRGALRGDDLVFGLAHRAQLAREVAALAPHVPCEKEAQLTASLRAGWIGALLLLPGVLLFLATSRVEAIVASAVSASADELQSLYLCAALPLAATAHALIERRRLRKLRRARVAS